MDRFTLGRTLLPMSLLSALLPAQLPDYVPTNPDTVLDTDFQIVQPTSGPPVAVVGGVFRFRNVTIPAGVRVRGVGSKPMIWLVDNLTVDGELSVSGEDGQRVNTLNSADFPARGGRGGAAGGRGGDGSPQIAMHSFAGMAGNGPGDVPGMGGTGGLLGASVTSLVPGSGGGGGAFATQGDPYYQTLWTGGTQFVQQVGIGGYGGFSLSSPQKVLPGGGPGGSPFADGDDENDFFWFALDPFRGRIVAGELTQLVGGGGGGGGGDGAADPQPITPQWRFDSKGGGGGGGGGCLVVAASNRIVVGPGGRITADGGHGGGGEQAGSCNVAGGGGGGAGGLLILAAGTEIQLEVQGETYANLDYDFVLSADGGVCRTGPFLTPHVQGKYPQANGVPQLAGSQYDVRPLGGFGGMGIVQLATRPGLNTDGTNTVLDDNIRLTSGGTTLTGLQKQRYLAWRGFKDAGGQRVDDSGNPLNIGAAEGDIRPSPILIALP